MSVYLNPGNKSFEIAINSEIYVDKSLLIEYTNLAQKTDITVLQDQDVLERVQMQIC